MLGGIVVAVLGGKSQPLQRLRASTLELPCPLGNLPFEPLRVVGELLLSFVLGADVSSRHVNHAFGRRSGCVPLQPSVAPIRRAAAVTEPDGLAGRTVSQGGGRCDGCLAVVGVYELDEGSRAHRLGGVAEQAFPRLVDAREATVQLRGCQQVERRVVIARDLGFQPAALIDEDAEERPEQHERGATDHVALHSQSLTAVERIPGYEEHQPKQPAR